MVKTKKWEGMESLGWQVMPGGCERAQVENGDEHFKSHEASSNFKCSLDCHYCKV